MRYNYQIIFVPGKQLVLADSLSRNPTKTTCAHADDLPEEIECYISFIVNNLPASDSFK